MASTVSPLDSVSNPVAGLPAQRERSRIWLLFKGVFSAAVVILVAECLRIFVGINFNTVAKRNRPAKSVGRQLMHHRPGKLILPVR
jgi:hypothetical protein